MKKRRIFAWVSGTAVLAILLLLLLLTILAVTVFKPKRPHVTVNSISVSNLDYSLAGFGVNLNVTLAANITVDNPNRAGFKFSNSTALLRFKGQDVGEVPIPAGEVRARDNTTLVLTLALVTDRMIFDSDFYTEALAGSLHFQAFIPLTGEVKVVFVIRVISQTSCDLDLNLANKTIANETCRYKIKL